MSCKEVKHERFFAGLMLSLSLWAQVDTGNISGTIRDSDGAVLTGAKVALRNAGSGLGLEI